MVESHQLCIGYNNKSLTEPFDLKLKENCWYGVIGANGSGKTTFFKTLLAEIKPISGHLLIMDSEIGKHNCHIGYIPQERELNANILTSAYSIILSSYNAHRWGIPIYSKTLKKIASDIIDTVGASDFAHKPFNTLSGGQKKRIYLAQALISEAKLLLMDEPLADLDPQSKKGFLDALRKIHKQTTLSMMMISHDMHEIAQYLDAFIHFRDNKVHFCKEMPCIKESAYVGI
ncbi:MAG: hypothetical protein A2X47_04785 [Lentisphaerae bacterium GWF2_38_69]|nr:MAG: hypothetical protein A2X47_04785 [Lentisphaerae bacterium GWF2_38_69]